MYVSCTGHYFIVQAITKYAIILIDPALELLDNLRPHLALVTQLHASLRPHLALVTQLQASHRPHLALVTELHASLRPHLVLVTGTSL